MRFATAVGGVTGAARAGRNTSLTGITAIGETIRLLCKVSGVHQV